jgi:hypothetical protein
MIVILVTAKGFYDNDLLGIHGPIVLGDVVELIAKMVRESGAGPR